MNSAQIHLMLNHVPIIGVIGAVFLIGIGLAWKSQDVLRVALLACLAAAVIAIPVFITGEPVEEAVEHLPGVTEALIERHEEAAKISMILLESLGLFALVGLLRYRRRPVSRRFATIAFAVTLGIAGQAGWAGHLGGQIRHSEIRAVEANQPHSPSSNGED